jgi:hypothetical protein
LGLITAQSRVLKASGSIAIAGDRAHYAADLGSNAVALVGVAAASWLGLSWVDAAAGLIVALWLIWGAIGVFREASGQLMDHELPEEDRAKILALATADRASWGSTSCAPGPRVLYPHADARRPGRRHLVAEAHTIMVEAENRLLEAFPAADILIHPTHAVGPRSTAACSPNRSRVEFSETCRYGTRMDDTLAHLPRAFAGKTVLVLGDVMLDRFIYGAVDRISPEAPVPVIAVEKETAMLGGAGNVARNVAALGAKAVLIGLVGQDDAGAALRGMIDAEPGLEAELVVDPRAARPRKSVTSPARTRCCASTARTEVRRRGHAALCLQGPSGRRRRRGAVRLCQGRADGRGRARGDRRGPRRRQAGDRRSQEPRFRPL